MKSRHLEDAAQMPSPNSAVKGPTTIRATVVESLVSGSLSSAITTILYQPLELLKTRVQLETSRSNNDKSFGRVTRSARELTKKHGFAYLWRGTGPSLLRSVPGVGLYYASLDTLQANLSKYSHKPNGPSQAFCFGLIARSFVSFILLPISVIKVRYESGLYNYDSLFKPLRGAYLRNGWIGVAPTILRDSLFSGIYYMLYTGFRAQVYANDRQFNLGSNFFLGIVSGLVASFLTHPLDVVKTRIQVGSQRQSMYQAALLVIRENNGYLRFLDGLAPRALRRTLIATSNWTFYEQLKQKLQ